MPKDSKSTSSAVREPSPSLLDWRYLGNSAALSSVEIDADNRDFTIADQIPTGSGQAQETHKSNNESLILNSHPLNDPRKLPESEPAGYIDLNNTDSARTSSSMRSKCEFCGQLVSMNDFMRHVDRECLAAKAEKDRRSSVSPTVKKSVKSAMVAATTSLVTCPVCKARVNLENLERHIRKVHRQTSDVPVSPKQVNIAAQSGHVVVDSSSTDGLIKCPDCGVGVNPKNLDKHIRKVHKQPGRRRGSRHPQNKAKRESVTISPTTDILADPSIHKLGLVEDEFYDKQYGDKYLGQARPESDGRYGSIPLYDDYSDEGWPD